MGEDLGPAPDDMTDQYVCECEQIIKKQSITWVKEETKQNVGAAPSQKNGVWRVKTEGRKEDVE